MKKWMLVLVSLMTALFLVACGKNSSETSGDNWSKYQSNKSITRLVRNLVHFIIDDGTN
ncbi:hypothetical protein ERS043914_01412, partial [Streptococcus pneumoniae]